MKAEGGGRRKRKKEPQAALLLHVLSVVFLVLMCQVEALPRVVVFYIFRGALMKAKGPIDSGIVMDCVDKKYSALRPNGH